MSVTMEKAERVTVFTVTSDRDSACPPICQIFRALCYSPIWCSASESMRKAQGKSQAVLGALQITTGLLNISLGTILYLSGTAVWILEVTMFPFWFGAIFIISGFVCMLSDKFPSRCLVTMNVILNTAALFSTGAASFLYGMGLAHQPFWRGSCNFVQDPLQSRLHLRNINCVESFRILLLGINGMLAALSAIGMLITASSVSLGSKTLKKREENKATDEPDNGVALLENV